MTEDDRPPLHVLRAARWLAHAQRDRVRALDLAARRDRELAVFCWQQAAEKALKAVLVAAGEPFERTHSLDRLLVRTGRLDPAFLSCPGDPERVTAYVSRFRYPDELGDDVATDEDVESARTVGAWLVERAEDRLAGAICELAARIRTESPPTEGT